MKTKKIAAIVFVMTFLFVACFQMLVSESAVAEGVSPFATAICESFRESTDKYEMCYEVYDDIKFREDEGLQSYSFYITSKDDGYDLGGVTVKIPIGSTSIFALFNDPFTGSTSADLIKDTIISSLLSIGASRDEADDLLIELADSYSGYAYSDIAHFNGYSLFIVPNLRELEYRHNDGGFYALRNDEYRLGTAKALKSPLTNGDRFFITGKVVDSEFQYLILDKYAQYIKVLTEDGDYVNMAFYYEEYPFTCKIGEQYKFYGKTNAYTYGESVLWVDLCEIIE